MPESHLRASDTDRAAVADVLGAHMSAGRLTVAEYDERLTRAYASKTYGELAELTADLPSSPPSAPRPAGPGAAGTGAHASTAGGESAGPAGAEQGPVGSPAGQPCGRDRQRNRAPGRLAHGGGPHWAAWGPWGPWMGAGSLRVVWGSWLSTALIVITIWAATSLASGEWLYFWPIWVVGPWGAVLLARTLTGDHRRDDRQLEGRAR
jgi:hypothetical protein